MINFSKCSNLILRQKPEQLPGEMRYFKSFSGKTTNIEPLEMSVKDFAAYITSGHAFYPCVLSDKNGVFKTVNKRCFEYANIIAFDLEKGNHSEIKVRDTLVNKGLVPCFMYRTYSHKQGENGDRNRIVYRLPYVIKNPAEYLFLGVLFWAIYKDIDTTCIDTARLFYGTVNQKYYLNEDAVLNPELFLQMGLEAIKDAKTNDTDLYCRIIGKLTDSTINAQINDDGLPVVCCKSNRIEFEENLFAKQARIKRESKNAALSDKTIESNAELPRLTIINWYDKAMCEPLFRELANGTGDFGYKKAVVIASNYRFIEGEEVKETFFGLLRDNPTRFSDINHTIEECAKIWALPTQQGAGFGCRPLPYRYCGEYPQNGYDYPLSFIRNVKRTIDLQRNKRVSEDLQEIIASIDFEANPHGFLINGGTGLGKTYAFLNDDTDAKAFSIKRALDERYKKPLKMAFLCSRQGARIQNTTNYQSTTDDIIYITDKENSVPHIDAKKIVCLTYHKFMMMIDEGTIDNKTFDIIVADECHSLFDDSFASQMGGFLVWALNYPGKIIWITANATYFQKCYKDFLELSKEKPQSLKRLYEDEGQHLVMRYDTNKIIYSTTSTIDYFLRPYLHEISPQKRMLVFLKSASMCYSWYLQAKKMGLHPAFYVSTYCDTELTLDDEIEEDVRQYLESTGRVSIQMNKVFEMMEDERAKRNSQRLKEALMTGENFPEDVDVIFTTDALRESINIQADSNVKIIITDDFNEIGILQKRGRVRADIDVCAIIPNRAGTERGLKNQIETFEGTETKRGVLNMTQQELAEEYGRQKQREKLNKGGTAYVLRFGKPDADEAVYMPNKPAYIGLKEKLNEFHQINPPNSKSNLVAEEKYSVLSSNPSAFNVVWKEPARRIFVDKEVALIAEKYAGLPLIGETQEQLLAECEPFLRADDGGKVFSLKLVLEEVKAQGFEVKTGKVSQKQVKAGLPEKYLRKNYRYIVPKK